MALMTRSIKDFEEKLRSFERSYQAAITERAALERDIAVSEKKIDDVRMVEVEVHRKKFLLEKKRSELLQIDRERRELERELTKLKKQLTETQKGTGMRK